MNIAVTKALIPVQRVKPVFKSVHQDAVCLDLYPERRRNAVIFTIRPADEAEGSYGPDRRKLADPSNARFIDVYI